MGSVPFDAEGAKQTQDRPQRLFQYDLRDVSGLAVAFDLTNALMRPTVGPLRHRGFGPVACLCLRGAEERHAGSDLGRLSSFEGHRTDRLVAGNAICSLGSGGVRGGTSALDLAPILPLKRSPNLLRLDPVFFDRSRRSAIHPPNLRRPLDPHATKNCERPSMGFADMGVDPAITAENIKTSLSSEYRRRYEHSGADPYRPVCQD